MMNNWKKFLLSACIALMISSCDKVADLLTFTITDETSFTVESTSPLNLPLEIATPEVTTNSNQKFENNNTTASLVKDIRLEELRLTVTNPAGKTFSFLKSIHIYISTDGEGEIELASLEEIPPSSTTVTLQTTSSKLDPYVKASSYQLRTSIVTDETLTQAVDVRMNIRFKVTASPR